MAEELMRVMNYLHNKEFRRIALSRENLVEKLTKASKKQKLDPKLALMSYLTSKFQMLNEVLNDDEYSRQEIEDLLIDLRFGFCVLFQLITQESKK